LQEFFEQVDPPGVSTFFLDLRHASQRQQRFPSRLLLAHAFNSIFPDLLFQVIADLFL
jgi:hypothetical protein